MFTMTVCRRLDNRHEGVSDDSPRATELHKLRARALHDVLDKDEAWEVFTWGDTDDVKPHEWVELWLNLKEVVGQVAPLAVPALVYTGKVLLEAGISTAATEAVKRLMARFRKKQKDNQLRDVTLTFPDGATNISCHPDSGDLTITVCRRVSLQYDATPAEVDRLENTTHASIDIPISLVPAVRGMIAKQQELPSADESDA
jgi:hypothetical protein